VELAISIDAIAVVEPKLKVFDVKCLSLIFCNMYKTYGNGNGA